MSSLIPFISGKETATLLGTVFPANGIARVPLEKLAKLGAHAPKNSQLWLDAGIDGLHDVQADENDAWFNSVSAFADFEVIADPQFQAKPRQKEVQAFVNSVLNACHSHNPAWVTVPQLPLAKDVAGNKINKALAKATGEWKRSCKAPPQLIFPMILTHQSQTALKANRTAKLKAGKVGFTEAQADGYWVVDASLNDEKGSSASRQKKFRNVVAFHEEASELIPAKLRIAGPYWGLSLVLWAKGLVDYPAVGAGTGYQYSISGGQLKTPTARIALPMLRRRATAAQVKSWIDTTVGKLGADHPLRLELEAIKPKLLSLQDLKVARTQVAQAQMAWFEGVNRIPESGRPLAMFQDLSAAYALGKSLPELAPIEEAARRPESIAEALMLICL